MATRAHPGQAAVAHYNQQSKNKYSIYLLPIDNDLTNKWLNRLRLTASTNHARDQLGQLSTVIEHFNKPSQNQGLSVIKYLR
jgi:7-keto-8-aminopelargonate synthetase-like enzyme